MNLSLLFWWVYQLAPADLVGILLVCTIVFFGLHRQLRDRRRWRRGLIVLLAVWAAAALWATVLNRSGGVVGDFQSIPFHSYAEVLAGGNREILRSNFMNVVLFYPAGLLSAAMLPKRWRFPVIVAVFAAFSLSVEIVQHVLALGRGEIDDVLHNTLGAVLGCMAFFLESKLFPTDKKEQNLHE